MHIPYSSHSAGGKTCLVVAYWAPWLNIPGSIRYRKLFSRLERHGWEIRLLTVGSARDCLRYGDPERCLAVPLLTARRLTSGKAAACAIPGLASRLPIHRVKAALSLLVRRVPVPRTYGWFRQWPRILAWSRRMAPDLILSTSPPPAPIGWPRPWPPSSASPGWPSSAIPGWTIITTRSRACFMTWSCGWSASSWPAATL